MNENKEVLRAIKRTDALLKRASLMLSTGKRGMEFPLNTEYAKTELQNYQDDVISLVAKLTNFSEIPSSWTPPLSHSYNNAGSREWTRWTWLEQLSQGLTMTKEFLFSFIEESEIKSEYNVTIENSPGALVAIANKDSSIQLVNTLSNDELNQLAEELLLLRKKLKCDETSLERDIAIGKVAEAELAARKRKKSEIVHNLKKAGKWVFDTATKIGISVTGKVISEIVKNN
jgi:hypothetical protein